MRQSMSFPSTSGEVMRDSIVIIITGIMLVISTSFVFLMLNDFDTKRISARRRFMEGIVFFLTAVFSFGTAMLHFYPQFFFLGTVLCFLFGFFIILSLLIPE